MTSNWADDPLVAEVLARYAAGQSIASIAAGLNRSYQAVWTVLHRAGYARPFCEVRSGARDRYLIRRGVMP